MSPAEQVGVLVVDDDQYLRNALTRYLTERGYRVESEGAAGDALQHLTTGRIALALVDIQMPGMSGIDMVPEALDLDPDLAIIMLTAVADATTAAVCMQRGALDYLTKPIELTDLGAAIDRALRKRSTLIQNREISAWLKEEVTERTRELARQRQKLQELSVATLEALINALEAKNPFLAGHSARVAAVAATIAHEMDLPDNDIEEIRMAGRLHDLGKIGVREAVLDKQGPLTREEIDHVRSHVTIGSQILAPLSHLGAIVAYVRGHHEHWDGSGYPDSLKGEDIPLGARILCVAEIYDALTTSRPYQDKMTPDEATERMRLLSGAVVDPAIMDALIAAVQRRRTLVFIGDEENTVG